VQRVEQHRIDRHDPRWAAIDRAAFASKNLYNAALYRTRQAYLQERRVLPYPSLVKAMAQTPEYRALPTKVAQWTLKQVCAAWHSFLAAERSYRADPSRFRAQPRLPRYLDKHGRYLLTYTTQALGRPAYKEGWIQPSGLGITVQTCQRTVRQVRIVPHATHYTVEIVYRKESHETPPLDPERVAAIDLGVDALATLTTNQPGIAPLLVNGRPLKSINQAYNQERARLQALLPAGQHTSHRLDTLTDKRARQINGYLHQASRCVVDWCLAHGIGTLVIGQNGGWKQEVQMGPRTNQAFVFIPHSRFVSQLRYKAEDVGLSVLVHEEAYTSRCSVLDNEPVGKHATYAGQRISRGLFRAADGRTIHADVNGSLNIMRKVVPTALTAERIEALVVAPVRLTTFAQPRRPSGLAS
jgi:putative transposase